MGFLPLSAHGHRNAEFAEEKREYAEADGQAFRVLSFQLRVLCVGLTSSDAGRIRQNGMRLVASGAPSPPGSRAGASVTGSGPGSAASGSASMSSRGM